MAANITKPKDQWRKHFIPLESNPEVFTELIHKLGMSDTLSFQDVYSIDDPELLAFIPRPAHALILVFPSSQADEKRVAEEDAKLKDYDACGEHEEVVYFKQTINNACGLYAILHAVCNGSARAMIGSESLMAKLLKECTPLKPEERARALENSKELEQAHASVASQGQTRPPDAEDEVEHHYICFVKSDKNGHLFYLDGMRKQPIDLGPLAAEDDVLSEKCLSFIKGMINEQGAHLGFGLMALVSR